MNDTIKPLQAFGILALAAVGFGAGIWLLRGGQAEPPANAPVAVAPVAPIEEPVEPAEKPANPANPNRPPPRELVPSHSDTLAMNGKEFTLGLPKISWGLPSPRRLTAQEKQAIAMLGTAHDTHSFRFGGMTLSDGSTIPGVPPLKADEVTRKVMDSIQAQGLADGFESAVRFLALPHNLDFLIVQVTINPDWADVEAILGKPQATHQGDLYLDKPPLKAKEYIRATWHRYGWLNFGVGKGQVRAIQADMRHAALVLADDVPGGRSKPDPSKVSKKKQRPPGAPPREVDALKLLGQATQVQVTTRRSTKPDPKLDGLVRDAQSLVGRDLHPGLVQTARQLKQSTQSNDLIVTPSQSPPIAQILEIMDETKFITDDTKTIPGQTVKWYRYSWLEFGAVNGQVERVRANISFVPGTGF